MDHTDDQPCGVCKFHWNMIVMPGERHNRNCPYADDAEKGCACQGCGERFKVDVMIPDDLWNRIRPHNKPEGAGLLCGRCIFSRIEVLGEFDTLTFSCAPVTAAPRQLTLPELNHLFALLEAVRESGEYAGPREQYYARTERLIEWCREQTRETDNEPE